jgi:hypothetical protein
VNCAPTPVCLEPRRAPVLRLFQALRNSEEVPTAHLDVFRRAANSDRLHLPPALTDRKESLYPQVMRYPGLKVVACGFIGQPS